MYSPSKNTEGTVAVVSPDDGKSAADNVTCEGMSVVGY